MKKSLSFLAAIAAFCSPSIVPSGPAGVIREEAPGEGTDTGASAPAPAKTMRKIAMDDGREVEFGEKTRMKKDYGVEDSNVYARIDFDNGKVVKVLAYAGNLVEAASYEGEDAAAKEVAKHAAVSLQLLGHGMIQKLGDSASGAETTDDALEAVLEVAGRISKGVFNKTAEGGGTSAKGAGELVQAMLEYLQANGQPEINKDQVRDLMSGLSAQEKNGLRKVPEVAAIIERLRAARKPSEGEQKKVATAQAILAAMKAGQAPVTSAPAGEAEEPASA